MNWRDKWVYLPKDPVKTRDSKFARDNRLLGKLALCISDCGYYLRVQFPDTNREFALDKKMFKTLAGVIASELAYIIIVGCVVFGLAFLLDSRGNILSTLAFAYGIGIVFSLIWLDSPRAIMQWLRYRRKKT